MPREVAHGFIALEALKKATTLGSRIEANPVLKSAFLLGSVTPDSGYYYKLPFSKGEIVSDLLHAVNENNSFHLAYKLIHNLKQNHESEIIEAFTLGYLTHILLDSAWHPFIFKITGDYYHIDAIERTNSRARHRRLESLIDSALLETFSLNPNNYVIKSYLKCISSPLLRILDKHLTIHLNLRREYIYTTWKYHSHLQSIFINNSISKNSKILPIKKEFRALFNPQLGADIERTKIIINEHTRHKFEIWIQSAIQELSLFFIKYEEDKNIFLKSSIGPSSNSGLVGISMYNGAYQIEEWLLEGF